MSGHDTRREDFERPYLQDADIRLDFFVVRDENGQRSMYPVTPRAVAYFEQHAGDHDLSENGWELDTSADAYATVTTAVVDAGLTFREAES
jgi:hypothetical protein